MNTEENTISVLIADDDQSVRTSLELILSERYNVTGAGSGQEAVRAIKEKAFNIAILDYKLPDRDGVSLAKEIKEVDNDIEVIILTGKASLESAIESVKQDIYDYLTKPIDPQKILEVIDGALQKQHLIKENRRLLWDLKKSNKELKKLNDFKDGLIAMISHDLRSPICSIKGFNESMLQGFSGELTEKQKDIINTENEIVDSMVELMNSLLDIRQIQDGHLKMKKKPCNIMKDAVEPTIKRHGPQVNEKNIKINLTCDENLPEVNIDPARISQVIQNLIQNSIKFTSKNGNINVFISNKEDFIKVEVKDDGKGIQQDLLNTIFDIFYTAESGEDEEKRRTAMTGRGLGLAISREIIKAHNGEIWAESEGEGKGSAFIFMLPIGDGK
jgi:signal transduction histidine kinase